MKLYTRTGDDGTTGLVGGKRIGKDDLRIDAYGTVDELNAALGLAEAATSIDEDAMSQLLRLVQADLFAIGSHLASPSGGTANVKLPGFPDPLRLENEIDRAEEQLAPLTNFILPGGSELAARLHVARCICRRAERLCVGLSRSEDVPETVIIYLNRLSDWLFAYARLGNASRSVADIAWRTDSGR